MSQPIQYLRHFNLGYYNARQKTTLLFCCFEFCYFPTKPTSPNNSILNFRQRDTDSDTFFGMFKEKITNNFAQMSLIDVARRQGAIKTKKKERRASLAPRGKPFSASVPQIT